jgi:2-polyprenyl-6-methoxyphenol hydroxylase-like FAD-dependent oxidoreductase
MSRHAVVVGAGIGGLCAAIGLRHAGWRVTVVERWPAVTGLGAGLGIWPDAQEALDRLGVGTAFRGVAVPFGQGWFRTSAGRRLAPLPTAPVERRGGRPVRILPRSALVEILHAAAEADGCHLRTRVDVADEWGSLRAADVVVAADGLHSTVRRLAFASASRPHFSGYVAWRGLVDAEMEPDQYGETWGPGSLFGVTRVAPGRTNWYAARRCTEDGGDLAWVRDAYRDWPDPVPALLARTDPTVVLRHPVHDLRPHLPSYVAGHVALLGDAAHAMLPNLGRGACEAILDADQLVRSLAAGPDVPTALRDYDRRRRPVTRRAVERSRVAMSVATTSVPLPRDAVMRVVSPLLR